MIGHAASFILSALILLGLHLGKPHLAGSVELILDLPIALSLQASRHYPRLYAVLAFKRQRHYQVSCATSILTHYYVVMSRDGVRQCLFLRPLDSTPELEALWSIAGLNLGLLPASGPNSFTVLDASTAEDSDVFTQSNGQTGSNFYSCEGLIDNRNPGHVQTDTNPVGLMGLYPKVFSHSRMPSDNLVASIISPLGISGCISEIGRGTVAGTAPSVSTFCQRVVHWFNNVAQYRVYANPAGAYVGNFRIPSWNTNANRPTNAGTYTMVLYHNELEVKRKSILQPPLHRFYRGSHYANMANPRVQQSSNKLPGRRSTRAHIKDASNPTTIKPTLTSSQTGTATLRIRTTLSFTGGKPQITASGWGGPAPAVTLDNSAEPDVLAQLTVNCDFLRIIHLC
ncbi:hypothetical protein BDV93DRAFT_502929 [Ceratobasidium sp. AG-I]|nr:hypothetical protein BDV93DRAFT_502929 [Ceratobasidium sp. AG-I]